MPGLGLRTVLTTIPVSGDGTASSSAAHLATHTGLPPVTHALHQSGGGIRESWRGYPPSQNATTSTTSEMRCSAAMIDQPELAVRTERCAMDLYVDRQLDAHADTEVQCTTERI
ncbi:hypothetical protein [Pseudonocardia yuanmonensis]|uniref:hypothetical protein n=1 Tax=Pseudonocardia yuanmonensis TaxID=1095914 RepID=UPI003CD07B9C